MRLSKRNIKHIADRLDFLLIEIGPRDQHGVLQLTIQQKDSVREFKDWLEDNYGPIN